MKHLEVRQKYSAARRIFNSLLGVSSGDESLRLILDTYYLKNKENLTGKFGLLYKLHYFTGRLPLKKSGRKNTNIPKLLFSGNQ